MDIVDEKTRSRMMAAVPQKDTKPEMIVRTHLFSRGFRYRLHVADLPGKPDIVLKKYNTVIFVHGCFWHRHSNCVRSTTPKNNSVFWVEKFSSNLARDRRSVQALMERGWNVIVIWECGLKPKIADLAWLERTICYPKNQYTEWPINA